jgi:hypothetical protein
VAQVGHRRLRMPHLTFPKTGAKVLARLETGIPAWIFPWKMPIRRCQHCHVFRVPLALVLHIPGAPGLTGTPARSGCSGGGLPLPLRCCHSDETFYPIIVNSMYVPSKYCCGPLLTWPASSFSESKPPIFEVATGSHSSRQYVGTPSADDFIDTKRVDELYGSHMRPVTSFSRHCPSFANAYLFSH